MRVVIYRIVPTTEIFVFLLENIHLTMSTCVMADFVKKYNMVKESQKFKSLSKETRDTCESIYESFVDPKGVMKRCELAMLQIEIDKTKNNTMLTQQEKDSNIERIKERIQITTSW